MRSAVCDHELLSDFLLGRLDQETEQSLVEHLNGCGACQREVEQLAGGERWFSEAQCYLSPERAEEGLATSIVLPLDEGAVDEDGDDELPPPIQLDFLAPTDDPHSLGRIGTYEVMGVVGRGGAGIVLKAFDGALDRYVAIKALSPNLAASAAARRRFAREAQAAAAVVHEHVVPIHAVSVHQGLPYIVMQYVAGRSLQQRLDAHGPLPLAEILRIGMQTAAGLAAAHAQGLVHRDVKPANILLENGVERVLVTDFGLARTVDDASLTCSGVIAGTPQYMSPEQSRGEGVDYRTDLFSLGSVLYSLATGHSPFRAETTMGVLHRICRESPRPVRQVNPEIPHRLAAIIDRLLAKNPAKRFASAGEVAEVLQRHLAELQSPTPRSSGWLSGRIHSTGDWLRDHGKRTLLVTAAVAGLIAGIVVCRQVYFGGDGAAKQAGQNAPGQPSGGTQKAAADFAQSERQWTESVDDVRTRLERLEAGLHSPSISGDPFNDELSALRQQVSAEDAAVLGDGRAGAMP